MERGLLHLLNVSLCDQRSYLLTTKAQNDMQDYFFLKAKVNRYIELYIQFIRIWNRSREFVIRFLSLLIHSLGLGIY